MKSPSPLPHARKRTCVGERGDEREREKEEDGESSTLSRALERTPLTSEGEWISPSRAMRREECKREKGRGEKRRRRREEAQREKE